MKRDIEWTEKLEDGERRIVRVSVLSREVIWQFKRTGDERWDRTTPPTAEDWAALEKKVGDRYIRRRSTAHDLELVKELRKKHG